MNRDQIIIYGVLGSFLCIFIIFAIIIPLYDSWILNHDYYDALDKSEIQGYQTMDCGSIDDLYYNKYKDTILTKPHHWDIIQNRHLDCIKQAGRP